MLDAMDVWRTPSEPVEPPTAAWTTVLALALVGLVALASCAGTLAALLLWDSVR